MSLTPQQMFDTALNHLRKQGKRAIDKNGECLYRAKDGCRCAVGALIPDDRYDPSLEGGSADRGDVLDALGLSSEHGGFLTHLQNTMHDCLRDGPAFQTELEGAAMGFAADHGLTYIHA